MRQMNLGPLSPEVEIKQRIEELSKEITRGWIVYGKFLDSKKTDILPATEVLEIVHRMEAERAELCFMLKPNDASLFIADNGSYLDK